MAPLVRRPVRRAKTTRFVHDAAEYIYMTPKSGMDAVHLDDIHMELFGGAARCCRAGSAVLKTFLQDSFSS
jgi:hypothetical protein